jgi:tetratricopeptide (TPR) repeat protein
MNFDVNQGFAKALDLLKAGRPADAEPLFRQTLAVDPTHVDSLHLLGVAAHHLGRNDEALDLISKAIALNDQTADFHCNLGLALFAVGRRDEAITSYRRAIALEPRHALAYNNLGNALTGLGRIQEGEAQFRRALELKPDYPEAHYNLANVLLVHGNLDDAVAHYRHALALAPNYINAHINLGAALEQQGKMDEAAAQYRRVVELDPRHAMACNNLGNALKGLGRMQEGETQFRRALELKPDYPEAHYNLANVLSVHGKLDDAVAHYRRALELAPDLIDAHINLGEALEQQDKVDEAAAQYRRVLELEPQNAMAHYNLGNSLRKTDYKAAIAHYKQALAGKPDLADAWNNLGVALVEQGDLDGAREAYQKAVEADPTRAAYHRNVAALKQFQPGDPQLAVLEQLIRNLASVPERERVDLQFVLAKAYADLKQHERSFRHLLAGNKLKRAQIGYDEAATMDYMQRIRTVFDAELLSAKAGGGEPASTPVFIIGMPRSGTTLIEQIIASHPKAVGAGELFDLDNIVHSLAGLDGGALSFPEVVITMSGEQLRQVGARYVAAIRTLAPMATRVADKMPWNFHFCGLIHLALPNARIIHARRDPIDTCLSCFSLLFHGDGNGYTYNLGELGRFYRAYDSLMTHWRAVLPPGLMLEVHYEEVVGELEKQARAIIAHCGLEWDDACLAFHKTRRPVRTSSFAQVRKPIYRSSVGRWRPYREQLRPLLDELGINPGNESGPAGPAARVVAEPAPGLG